ncbi:MAG: GNAT family N-acetyltransferase [Clostridiales Family XIII bacterium]|jgi:ribosomal protein S18 acetylase RimI-like enzyme|nr:GNAT family N-acetyltransferase [Clostridiales Family XIII bacterium]
MHQAAGERNDGREAGAPAGENQNGVPAGGVRGAGGEPSGTVTISETDAYDALVTIFIRNGLEFSAGEALPTDLVKCWEAAEPAAGTDLHATGRRIGGCVLALREGAFIIDGIAVEPEYRAHKLGKRLLSLAVSEVKARGGKELFLVARAPEFFRKQGFVTVPRAGAPTFFECFTCPQCNVSCFPEVMRLELVEG